MIQKYIKHYIRVDNNNCIIKGFTDFFEKPKEVDICIDENLKAHFQIGDLINPVLFDENSKPLYKFSNNNIVKLSVAERKAISPYEHLKTDKQNIEELEILIAALIGGAL